jgi:hypothetical protein
MKVDSAPTTGKSLEEVLISMSGIDILIEHQFEFWVGAATQI